MLWPNAMQTEGGDFTTEESSSGQNARSALQFSHAAVPLEVVAGASERASMRPWPPMKNRIGNFRRGAASIL